MSDLQTKTYVILCEEPSGTQARYVGEAIEPAARFRRHQRNAANPANEKSFYRFLREHGIRNWYYEVLDGVTEAEAIAELTLAGAVLFNDNAGITSTVKKKKDHSFSRLNRDADERVEQSERRQVLHGKAQVLSKSDVVRQRLLNAIPTVEELMDAPWRSQPAEMLGVQIAKTATSAEYLRWSDYKFSIAYREKRKVTEVSGVIERSDGYELRAGGWWMSSIRDGTQKQRLLTYLIRVWGDNTIDPWIKPYRGV